MEVIKLLEPSHRAGKLLDPAMLHRLGDWSFFLLLQPGFNRVVHPLQEDSVCSEEEALD